MNITFDCITDADTFKVRIFAYQHFHDSCCLKWASMLLQLSESPPPPPPPSPPPQTGPQLPRRRAGLSNFYKYKTSQDSAAAAAAAAAATSSSPPSSTPWNNFRLKKSSAFCHRRRGCQSTYREECLRNELRWFELLLVRAMTVKLQPPPRGRRHIMSKSTMFCDKGPQ